MDIFYAIFWVVVSVGALILLLSGLESVIVWVALLRTYSTSAFRDSSGKEEKPE